MSKRGCAVIDTVLIDHYWHVDTDGIQPYLITSYVKISPHEGHASYMLDQRRVLNVISIFGS